MNELATKLSEEFADEEYAHSYMQAHSSTRLAAQIYALRKQRGWSQQELAIRSGIAQERISKIESADFESLTMKTLRKFARAFDVNLSIGFETFSDGIENLLRLDDKSLQVKSRPADLATVSSHRAKKDKLVESRNVVRSIQKATTTVE